MYQQKEIGNSTLTLLDMATKNIIAEAIEMINGHDWYWRMADYGFESRYQSAKATMKAYVALVANLTDSTVKQALRDLWTLHYNVASDDVNGRNTDYFEAQEASLLAIING